MQETQEFRRHPRFADLGMLKARFTRHRYELHTHPTYVVALITEGCERLRVGRQPVVAPAGSIVLVNPEECHDGEPGADGGWTYWTLYPTVSLLASVAAELAQPRPPLFSRPVIDDPGLAAAVARAHAAAATNDPLGAETALLIALRGLILRCARCAPRHEPVAQTGSHRRLALYRDVIGAGCDDAIDLQRLAAAAGVTRFQVIRDFKREVGLTPGAFIRHRRLRHAGQLIAAGCSLAAAATAAGFADQSHLTRSFKAVHGMTPGTFQQAMRREPGHPGGSIPLRPQHA